MFNSATNAAASEAPRAFVMRKSKNALLLADGGFLIVVGLFFGVAELLSHFWGIGPQGTRFLGTPYTIGFFEAHGLAALIGFLLVRAAGGREQRFWHGFAALVHLLLGGSNLAYWVTFVAYDSVAQGVAITVVHGIFVVLQLIYFMRASVHDGK